MKQARLGDLKKSRSKTASDRCGHRKTREEHAQETAQDYVELIAKLIDDTGEARAIDIARSLTVTHVTVGRTIRRLQRLGLVSVKPYRSIFLTSAGISLAKESRKRHDIVSNFLIALGVPPSIAESDAEGIEHHVSRETLLAFSKYIKIAKRRSGSKDTKGTPKI